MHYSTERTAGRTKRNCTAYILVGKSLTEPPVIYVGKSTTFPSRMSTHYSYLKDKKHHSSILQEFCDRNGLENMICIKVHSSGLNVDFSEEIESALYSVFSMLSKNGKFVLANEGHVSGYHGAEAVKIVVDFIENMHTFPQESLSKYDFSEFWKQRPRKDKMK